MSELTTDQLCWDLAPAPWPSSARLLAFVVEVLPTIDDEPVADLIEQLALLVVERDEEVAAVRVELSVALDLLHKEQTTSDRRRTELYRLRDEYHSLRATRSQQTEVAVPS